jgi:hypothetical protein
MNKVVNEINKLKKAKNFHLLMANIDKTVSEEPRHSA